MRPSVVLLSLLAVACQQQAVEFGPATTVPKAARPIRWDATLGERMGEKTEGPKWAATVPPGWEQLPAQPARFRDLLLRVSGRPDTECYLTVGVGGGVEANLRRWYVEQAGKAEAPTPETLPVVDFGGNAARLAEIVGTIDGKEDQAMLIAFVAQGQAVTTLKFVGPKDVVLAQKDSFLAVARSVRRESAAGPAAQPQPAQWSAPPPQGWEQLPAQPARFRDLLYRVAGQADTECYLTAASFGGVAMNLGRWYVQQAGRNEVPAVESLPEVPFAGGTGRYVELTGTIEGKPERGMLIVFSSTGEQLTTLKFVGPAATVLAEKERFLELAKSLRRDGAASAPGAPANPLPPGHSNTPPPTPAHAAVAPFTATTPAGWTPKADSPRLLHHTFGSDSEIYVSQLSGTPRQNLDIWRGEMGQSPLDDRQFAELPKVPMLGGEGLLMDLAGDFRGMTGKSIPGARLLVAAYPEGATILFVKLVGPAAEIDAQLDAFKSFCASLKRAM